MGLFQINSLREASYILTFIEDFSKMTFSYLIKHKDQNFDKFNDLKALVENQTEFKIKMLRFENGGEYNINEFN